MSEIVIKVGKAIFQGIVYVGLLMCVSSCVGGNDSKGRVDNGWKCWNVQYDKICCPESWHPLADAETLFFSQIADSDENTYLAILRHDTSIERLTMADYLKLGVSALTADTTEPLESYNLNELQLKDGIAVFGEYSLTKQGNQYRIFSMYTIREGLLYDISLKVLEEKKEYYYAIFQDLLYKYEANGKHLYTSEKDILSVKPLEIDAN